MFREKDTLHKYEISDVTYHGAANPAVSRSKQAPRVFVSRCVPSDVSCHQEASTADCGLFGKIGRLRSRLDGQCTGRDWIFQFFLKQHADASVSPPVGSSDGHVRRTGNPPVVIITPNVARRYAYAS